MSDDTKIACTIGYATLWIKHRIGQQKQHMVHWILSLANGCLNFEKLKDNLNLNKNINKTFKKVGLLSNLPSHPVADVILFEQVCTFVCQRIY